MLSSLRSGARTVFRPGETVLVAASGGADSQALLHGLSRLAEEQGLSLAVGHVDHGLRGVDSAGDAAFVAAEAARLGLPCGVRPVRAAADRRPGESLEMTCRRLRRAALRDLAAAAGASVVALAHHRRDQAETLLLRLCRGAGPDALAGMRPRWEAHGLAWARPLLEVEPDSLRAWLQAEGLSWREDASNQEDGPRRNRLRREALPWLERRVHPAALANLADSARRAREDADWIAAQVERIWRAWGEPTTLNPGHLAALPPALSRRLAARWLVTCGLPVTRLGAATLEALLRVDPREAGSLPLPGGWRVVWSAGGDLRLREREPPTEPAGQALVPGEAVAWPTLPLTVSACPDQGFARAPRVTALRFPCAVHLCARRAASGSLTLRGWRAGDRLRVFGGCTRKLQDILTEMRVPRDWRAHLPVVAHAEGVVAVPGGWIAEGWQVDSVTAPSWRVEWRWTGPTLPASPLLVF
jgi:tRNA(Ile)-lysidine synthase